MRISVLTAFSRNADMEKCLALKCHPHQISIEIITWCTMQINQDANIIFARHVY
jgi:hypothetical protein